MNVQRKIWKVEANIWSAIVKILTRSPFVQALVQLIGKAHLYRDLIWLFVIILLWITTGLTLLILLLL